MSMTKGISTVIATLLMLIITIALAGFAYSYLINIVSQRTGVVLSVLDSGCAGEFIQATVKNDGTSTSSDITVTATAPDGSTSAGSCTVSTLNGGTSGSCSGSGIDRPTGAGGAPGTYRLRIVATGAAPATGSVYCASQGT